MKMITMMSTATAVAFVSGLIWNRDVAMLLTAAFMVGCILVAVCHNLIDEAKD